MNIHSSFLDASMAKDISTLESLNAEERLLWALNKHGNGLALTSSFGIQAAVLLHMVKDISKKAGPNIPIVFIDTEHLHYDTYRYMNELKGKLDLDIITYRPLLSARQQEALYGQQWNEDGITTDTYKEINKREPMRRAVHELGITGWISGQRRSQGDYRAHLPPLQQDGNIEKIYPLIDWTESMVIDYMQRHDLPFHPLAYENYRTIGDYFENPDIRSECGLHDGRVQSFDPKI